MINSALIIRLTIVFLTILVCGLLLCVPLFKFDLRKFIHSKLFIKVLFWVPIFILFSIFLYLSNFQRLIFLGILICLCADELYKVMKKKRSMIAAIYFCILAVALLHFYFVGARMPDDKVTIIITVGFASVLADVFAFFMGNYMGVHKLPEKLNNGKSWEGVAGQMIGALVGVAIIKAFVVKVDPFLLFLPIGVGAAVGDLSNSYVKRKLGIKDWSNSIPEHGGYIDRLSSLAGSMIFTFYFMLLFT